MLSIFKEMRPDLNWSFFLNFVGRDPLHYAVANADLIWSVGGAVGSCLKRRLNLVYKQNADLIWTKNQTQT